MNGSAAASRSLAILLLFARRRTLTVAEISDETGIPPSAVYRNLLPLLEMGLVSPTERRGQYGAGPETLGLAANYRHHTVVRNRVTEHLQILSDETQELAAYLVVSGFEALCVDAVEGQQALRCSYAPGSSLPLLKGASAVTLLAHLPPDARTLAIEHYALPSEERALLEREVALVLDRGFGLSYGAVDQGVWGASFPILTADGALTGVITTMAPAARAVGREKNLIASTRRMAMALTQHTTEGRS